MVTDEDIAEGLARLREQRGRDGQPQQVESEQVYGLLAALLADAD